MAEETEGFTFVDKRRTMVEDDTVADSLEQENTASASVSDADVTQPESSTSDAAGSPSIYDILLYSTQLLAADAWQKMGLLADPQTGVAKQDLTQAKIGIDAVGDLISRLESAPESAVPPQIRRDLRTLLNDLRLNYVGQRDTAA